MKKEHAPQYIQYLDGLINLEVLKRAAFPIKVCPHDSSVLEVHRKHQVELTNLYREVSEEMLAKYAPEENNGIQISNL